MDAPVAGGSFAGRVALVTGGGGGIGRAAALAFAREGARVVVADADLALAEETCALARGALPVGEAAGAEGAPGGAVGSLLPFRCDVACAHEVEALVQFTVSTFGAVHHCLNNAGIEGKRAPLHEADPADFARVMAVNAGGVFNCMQMEIRQMLAQLELSPVVVDGSPKTPKAVDRTGLSIVNTSSTAGLAAMAEFSPYCASKHAVTGLTRCAAKEYAQAGIRINCVCPSTTDTPMVGRFSENWPDWQERQNASFPTGRIGTPAEVAEAVLWLSSPKCPMVCGACLTIDGALTA